MLNVARKNKLELSKLELNSNQLENSRVNRSQARINADGYQS